MENPRRPAADRRDLQPSFHRDGCSVDHSRSDNQVVVDGAAVRLARDRGRAGELHYYRVGAHRRGHRDADRRRAEHGSVGMRGLANAAVEGLLVCEGDTIVTVNNSFADLVGCRRERMTRSRLEQCFPDEGTRLRLFERPNRRGRGRFASRRRLRTPVELILRPVDYGGKPHHAIAVRDLQARNQAGATYPLSRAS